MISVFSISNIIFIRIFYILLFLPLTTFYTFAQNPLENVKQSSQLRFKNERTLDKIIFKKGDRIKIIYKGYLNKSLVLEGKIKYIGENSLFFKVQPADTDITSITGGSRGQRVTDEILYDDILAFKKVFKYKLLFTAILSIGATVASIFILDSNTSNRSLLEDNLISLGIGSAVSVATQLAFNSKRIHLMEDQWSIEVVDNQ